MPFLIFAILVGFLVYRKANSAAQNNAQKSGQPAANQRPQPTPAPKPARPAPTAERNYQGVNRPGAEGYAPASPLNTERPSAVRPSAERPAAPEPRPVQTREKTETAPTVIRPTVKPVGSLHYVSQEGQGSMEGTASTEGECIEENPQHCAVEHLPDDVYDADTGFAVDFDRRKLLSAMIMGEVLNAPKWKTN